MHKSIKQFNKIFTRINSTIYAKKFAHKGTSGIGIFRPSQNTPKSETDDLKDLKSKNSTDELLYFWAFTAEGRRYFRVGDRDVLLGVAGHDDGPAVRTIARTVLIDIISKVQ